MRKAYPWQRTGGVADRLCVMPASAKAVEPATRNAREEVSVRHPRKAGVQSDSWDLEALDSCFRRNDVWADHPASRLSLVPRCSSAVLRRKNGGVQ